MWDINSGDNGLSMFSCMGSQLDMGDRERKALRKVHCTTQQLYIVWLYNKNEVHNYNSAETKMLQSWLYMNDKISQDILNLKILWARRLRKWEKEVTILSKNLHFYFSGCWGIQEFAEGKWKIAGTDFVMKLVMKCLLCL